MERSQFVLDLVSKKDSFYREKSDWIFSDEQNQSGLWESFTWLLDNMYTQDDPTLSDTILLRFAGWYLHYAQYAWARLGDKALQKKSFADAGWCAYQSIRVLVEVGRIRGRINLGFSSGDMMHWWTNLLLSGWYEEADEIMQYTLASTNDSDNQGVMGEGGNSLDTSSFFLMELYCLWKKKPFDRDDFDHPLDNGLDTPFIYDEVLPHWNTKDLQQVDDLVSVMADYHLTRTIEQDEDTDEEDQDHFEFSHPHHWLYPFEILAWLKVRSMSGLSNPDQYTHPLMNQPLAEPITDAPLPRPTNHKETNQILDLVCKHYPTARL